MATPYSPTPQDPQPPAAVPEKARISIPERFVPAIALAVASISGTVGAWMIIQLFDKLRRSETAGLSSILDGLMKIELIMSGVLGLALILGLFGLGVCVVRMFTTNTTASPAGVRMLAAGVLSLISPSLILYSAYMITDAVNNPATNLSNTAEAIDLLNYGAFAATGLSLLMLLIFSFVPFRSRLGRKYSPTIAVLFIECAILTLAMLFAGLANAAAGMIQKVG